MKMERKKILMSGMQPTGSPHIGNYLGAVKNWVHLQKHYEAYYSIVDLHAITVPYDPSSMQQRILGMAAVLMACGLDPENRCALFVQSQVPQHTQLCWILNTVTPMAELYRMTQFKEKSEQYKRYVNVGLFDYPVLQAADILLYHAAVVPVGEDQLQHIELTRTIARKFNNRFGSYFPLPEAIVSKAARIMGLDGKAKMSKSLNNDIDLLDSPDEIWAKLKVAYTDPARKRKSDPGNPFTCNMYTLHTYFSRAEEQDWAANGCRTASIGCFQCKKVLADNIIAELSPIRQRALDLIADEREVKQALERGAEKAREVANKTMQEVYELTGLAWDRPGH